MKKHCFICILIVLICQLGFSQEMKKQTIAIQGSSHFIYANNKSFFIQESIGQGSVINTYTTDRYSLRQGYLQPISPAGITSQLDFNLDATIFPNPFTTKINVKFNEPVVDIVDVKLYDLLGRIILNKQYNPEELIVITLDELSSGSYILRVKMRQQELTANLIRK